MKISWDETPHSRYSDVISYRIKLRRYDGLMIEHSQCDGTSQTVNDNRECFVAVQTLLGAEFSLVEGDLVLATVEALNAIDYSIPSLLSGTATV